MLSAAGWLAGWCRRAGRGGCVLAGLADVPAAGWYVYAYLARAWLVYLARCLGPGWGLAGTWLAPGWLAPGWTLAGLAGSGRRR